MALSYGECLLQLFITLAPALDHPRGFARKNGRLVKSDEIIYAHCFTCAFSCIKRRSAAKLTALNLASIAAIMRLMMAHVAVTISATKNQIVYSDITRCVNIIT